MSLKPIRSAPLPPSKTNLVHSTRPTPYIKHDDNNNKHAGQPENSSLCPTVIRPKQNDQQQRRKKKPPPPRPAPPKINRSGIGKSNIHGKQHPLHVNSLLEDDLANLFGGCNYDSSDKFKSKSQCQSFSKKQSQQPRFIRRSMKKRAPNPLNNNSKCNSALIDFDSPAFDSSNSNGSQAFNDIFSSAQGKTLLDLDDPLLSGTNNQVLNLPKSNSLPIDSAFQRFPTYTMNRTEKCENYVSAINSMSYSQAKTTESLQKKPAAAPHNSAQYAAKESNKTSLTAFCQPTVIYPAKSTKNKLPVSQSDGQIYSTEFSQKQNTSTYSTVSFRNGHQKEDATCANAEQLNVNWENASNFPNYCHATAETDHCASPFSDISSHNTVSSLDSSDELCCASDNLPEPEFPPPPPPPENSMAENNSINNHTTPQICKALYDFQAESSEELGFRQGELIHFEKKITDEWWQGYSNGQHGIFPSSFVEFVSNQRIAEPEQKSCTVIALFQFDGEEEGDLSFKAGDEVRVLSRINKDWLFGEFNGRKGQFPASFVKQKQMYGNNKGLCIARYPFIGENSDELSFEEGEKIIVTEYINEDWWRGMMLNNHSKAGIFPCNFVEKLDDAI